MNRILSSFLALAMCASLGSIAVASSSSSHNMSSSKTTTSSTKCPKGETYVKGYTKSNGTKVKGYCRKS